MNSQCNTRCNILLGVNHGFTKKPDSRAYRDYRHYLLETSQVAGGYYSSRGRRVLLRSVVDMMIATPDPYDALAQQGAAPKQQLRLVSGHQT